VYANANGNAQRVRVRVVTGVSLCVTYARVSSRLKQGVAMPDDTTLSGASDRLPVLPIRIFRLEPGASAFVRLLSPRYGGLFTHWKGGRSIYCAGEDCPAALHSTEKFWKGYGAVEAWCPIKNLWYPAVFELTEHLELDFRGQWERGQVWEVQRVKHKQAKREPIRADLQELLDANTLPADFDFLVVLKRMYHRERIDLGSKNPLPPKICLPPSVGLPPQKLCPKPPAAPLIGKTPSLLERDQRYRRLKDQDDVKRNGNV